MGEAEVVGVSGPIVKVAGFCKSYRKHLAVRGVDLDIQRGEIYGLIGPDGSGKSSLMKAIAGVLTFDAGEVEVFGTKIVSERSAERIKGRIGFMPQGLGLNLYPELSVEENIDFFAQLRLVPKKALAERKGRLLAMTRLDRYRERPMKHLSGGMKQKLGLVCTLIHEPELLILDEPTTGVDPVSRRDFWAILAKLLREGGTTALVSTAYMDEATRFHRLSLLYQGQVLAQGEPDEILAMAPGSLVALRAEPQAQALHCLKECFPQVEALGPSLRVFVDDSDAETAAQHVRKALAGLQIEDLHAARPELEDVFVARLRRKKLIEVETNPTPAPSVDSDPPARDGIAIEAVDLVCDFDHFRAVDHVGFQIPQGEIFGLLGPNGAGKTTVIKMLTGILRPTVGYGQVVGADMRRAGKAIKERIGYMSQAFTLYQDLSVLENIRLYAGIYGLNGAQTRERTAWITDMAGLHGHEADLASNLPMGVRQRLALGCALVHRPQVLFLDEPTSGVDPIGRRQFWDILFQLSREENVTILITTHYMSEAEHCDRLALMHAGRIVTDGSPAEMKDQVEADAGRLLELRATQPLLALELLEKAGFVGVSLFGRRIHLLSPDPQAAEDRIRSLLAERDIGVLDIAEMAPSLEDVFVYRVLTLERRTEEAA